MEKQSSEEGERRSSMDIDREIENIERSINKSVRSETRQEQQPAAARESNSDDEEDSANKTIVDDFVGEIQQTERRRTTTNRAMETSFQYVPTLMDD